MRTLHGGAPGQEEGSPQGAQGVWWTVGSGGSAVEESDSSSDDEEGFRAAQSRPLAPTQGDNGVETKPSTRDSPGQPQTGGRLEQRPPPAFVEAARAFKEVWGVQGPASATPEPRPRPQPDVPAEAPPSPALEALAKSEQRL